jgi:hypothetical protein
MGGQKVRKGMLIFSLGEILVASAEVIKRRTRRKKECVTFSGKRKKGGNYNNK